MVPTSSRDRAEAEEQGVKAPLASVWATSATEGWETLTQVGLSGQASAASRLSTCVETAGPRGRLIRHATTAAMAAVITALGLFGLRWREQGGDEGLADESAVLLSWPAAAGDE
jgi:hypothetical protein